MGEEQGGKAGGEKKAVQDASESISYLFKMNIHCEGCAKKIKRVVKHCEGVKDVAVDYGAGKITAIGKVDPAKILEKLEERTKKKAVFVSPKPTKETAGSGGGENKVAAAENSEKKTDAVKKPPPPAPVVPKESTVVLKIRLHCDGCIQKIKKVILKIKGVQTVTADAVNDVLTVRGTMEVKELAPFLREKLKRNVQVIDPRNDAVATQNKVKDGGSQDNVDKEPAAAGKKSKSGDKKKEASGGGKKEDSSGEKKEEGGDGGDKNEGTDGSAAVALVSKMDHYGYSYPQAPVYWHDGHVYGQHYSIEGDPLPAYANKGLGNHGYASEGYAPYHQPNLHDEPPQLLSDENPNGCSVM